MELRNDTLNSRRGGAISLMRRAFVLIILAGAVVGGILYWQKADHAPQVVQTQAPQKAMPVHVVTLQSRTVPLQPMFLGQTEASQTVEIRARVNGFLESKHFEEGGRVTEGQTLFRIDPRSFQAEMDVAQARLTSAEAQLMRARQKVKRYTELLRSDAATEDELEEWQTEERVAVSNIELEKARITQAKLDLSYTTITSPINGRIGMAKRDVGSYVDGSSDGLLAVVEKTDPIYVRYNISEQDLLLARRLVESGKTTEPSMNNMRLRITLADGTPYAQEGEITYTDPQIDPATGSLVVRGTFPNPDGRLQPGQFVHVRVTGIDRLNALLIPKEAVIQNPTGSMVYVVNAQKQAEIRRVVLGPWQNEQWIIESGLEPGETVIVDRLMQLRPGALVEPLPAVTAETPASGQPRAATEM
ncbi:RND family efflux transporter, MFP subunit [Desulfocurvibacter africanus PCS]|uniref:RND family efflux transporter, MFP subunit n=1 Tax=Desulfocurvibacter africanus PCS TaxID=1262666 RepID=M5Q261_DESAF|nr:efflux RND transporter periplasmic adaptor subunit [Desulfocurvibacter africanus]EMG38171.1 RND family efflux transporter, MFP subunit [Desulfocurvibacter africanus PCS]